MGKRGAEEEAQKTAVSNERGRQERIDDDNEVRQPVLETHAVTKQNGEQKRLIR